MADSGEKFLYFLIGGFVGASVALLMAPRSGEETRHLLGGKYREGVDELGRRVQSSREQLSDVRRDLSKKVEDIIEKGKSSVDRQKEQLSSAIEAGKKAYSEEKSKLDEKRSGLGESI